jgi:hypothetical protein
MLTSLFHTGLVLQGFSQEYLKSCYSGSEALYDCCES